MNSAYAVNSAVWPSYRPASYKCLIIFFYYAMKTGYLTVPEICSVKKRLLCTDHELKILLFAFTLDEALILQSQIICALMACRKFQTNRQLDATNQQNAAKRNNMTSQLHRIRFPKGRSLTQQRWQQGTHDDATARTYCCLILLV